MHTFAMPAIRRLTRSCALTLVTLSLAVTTAALGSALAPTPAVAAGSGAVVSSSGETKKHGTTRAARRSSAARRVDTRIRSAQQTAVNQRGDAYAYGASGPNAFDCSGLIYYSYRKAGLNVPRTSDALAAATRRVAKRDMRPGDLMFFSGAGGVYHAGIFTGYENGHAMMVHSPGSGRRVTVTAPWTDSWFGGTVRR